LPLGRLKFCDKHLQTMGFISQVIQNYICILLFIIMEIPAGPRWESGEPAEESGLSMKLSSLTLRSLYWETASSNSSQQLVSSNFLKLRFSTGSTCTLIGGNVKRISYIVRHRPKESNKSLDSFFCPYDILYRDYLKWKTCLDFVVFTRQGNTHF
jgi:hypothetical protein